MPLRQTEPVRGVHGLVLLPAFRRCTRYTHFPQRTSKFSYHLPRCLLPTAFPLLSAFELARRHLLKQAVKIETADDVVALLADIVSRSQEHFVCITLNGANELIEKRVVTIGLLDRSLVHPRDVFADVISDRAAAVILAHNHPSGDLQPSEHDLETQRQLEEAGKILGIRVLDHVIVSKKGYFSFQEAGLIH